MKRIIFITILILCSVSLMLGQSKFSLGEAAMKKGNYDQAITYFLEAKKAATDAATVSLCNQKIAKCNRLKKAKAEPEPARRKQDKAAAESEVRKIVKSGDDLYIYFPHEKYNLSNGQEKEINQYIEMVMSPYKDATFEVIASCNSSIGDARFHDKVAQLRLDAVLSVVKSSGGNYKISERVLGGTDVYSKSDSGENDVVVIKRVWVDNPLSKGKWRTAINRAIKNNATEVYGNGVYKGQKRDGQENGLGVFCYEGGSCYFGNWKNGERDGLGLYIVRSDGYDFGNCKDCVYYVGGFSNGKGFGKGTCYDKYGNLIYYGNLEVNSPTETYPQSENWSDYKFECIEYSSGSYYIGETKKGQRHGVGIFLWDDGDVWYGQWKDGERNGPGILLNYDGGLQGGNWMGDTRTH